MELSGSFHFIVLYSMVSFLNDLLPQRLKGRKLSGLTRVTIDVGMTQVPAAVKFIPDPAPDLFILHIYTSHRGKNKFLHHWWMPLVGNSVLLSYILCFPEV